MKDYKDIYCIEGDYFDCPVTNPPNIEKQEQEPDQIFSRKLPLSTDNYRKFGVTKKSYKIIEK